MNSSDQVTLQINISPGDINYARLTVSALVNQHLEIKKRLLVVDCCRPQKTHILDPDTRFPAEKFERDTEEIIRIANQLLEENIVSDVYFLKPDDPIIDHLSKKYLRGLYKTTHGAGGMVNMGYWVGFDLPDTRYVLHYDGDIMLYQKPGYKWVDEAIAYMEQEPDVFVAIPRLCPMPKDPVYDIPSFHEMRAAISTAHYWKNDWFSTRHFLLDKQKFDRYLPLVRGKVMLELLVRKYGKKAFPLDPEIVMFKSIGPRGGKRMVLKSHDAWITHPIDKSAGYLKILPQIIRAITNNRYPDAQIGNENMNLEAWSEFLKIH
jgi:hypothetical protein